MFFVLFSETFEINGNELTGPEKIDFDTDMPEMSELTVSFWVKLSGKKLNIPWIYFRSDVGLSLDFKNSEHEADIPSGIDFTVSISR